ncbi:MAG: aminoacyl-tRNA hydrolase [Epsilonproteobacteria bacterium]|nr:aminoacyl-tRNA hydrolase [Campylobacterota bacterium]NPA57492.1 aminoacyl-tRNA hydrolase [Campylobacterota bacterium]
MYLIVGLGNPGEEYRFTRHNVGFLVLDEIIEELQPLPISSSSFKGELYRAGPILLLKPLTFMNRSGESLQAVAQFYKIDPERTIVIHDDIDLPLGALRFKKGGGSGGHNGLRSIDRGIGKEYMRVRVGIGRPREKGEVADYVLSPFGPQELETVQSVVKRAGEAAIALTQNSLDYVRERYSQKGG